MFGRFLAQKTPAANSSESPGSTSPSRMPVSQKMIAMIAIAPPEVMTEL